MNKGNDMISERSALGWLTRFAQVRFLALVAMLTLLIVPAFAADESTPTDLPGQQPAQPAVEPAQPIDESTPPDTIETQLGKFIKSVVDAAKTRAETTPPDATQTLPDEDPGAATAGPAPQEDVQDADLKAKEAEIETITAQIEQERIASAKRIADLEDQLNEARGQLAAITSLDNEGFIRAWLVLGPIPVDEKVSNHDEESNKDLLDRQYMPPQAMPVEGDTLSVDETELTWTAIRSGDYFVDLAKVAADQERNGEHAAYLGVAYITSEEEVTGVKLCVGSDDDSVWRLNGKEVLRSYTGRGIEKDQDSADDLTLKQGVNVLTFTVLNGEGPSAAAARFVDEDGNPIRGLKVSLAPPTEQVTQTDNAPAAGNDGQPAK